MSEHPFDRYGKFTNLKKLLEYSEKPLRKCLRVNTLKTDIETFIAWAKEQDWELTQVPWCKEGFFVERGPGASPIGKDLFHLLGYAYVQEASSMLPPVLLDPQPGEAVLDIAAAPGSKTTQMACMMSNTGVIVANDVQEKRLWTLKTALHRSGVINYIVMKRMGQWYGNHMAERFDRVLCDAPCTAQGTIRKDPSALTYCSIHSIGKMAKLQREILESAVHSCKVGGRILYSTCTLAPEENEEVVHDILNKYCDQIEVLDPLATCKQWAKTDIKQAIKDSKKVQKSLGFPPAPLLRIWPQTFDSEGFFCAVLQKKASTKEQAKYKPVHFQEHPLSKKEQTNIAEGIGKIYGTSFMEDGEALYQREDLLLLTSARAAGFGLPDQNYSLGLPYAKGVKGKTRFRLTHDLAIARGRMATKNYLELSDDQANDLTVGKDIPCDPKLWGDIFLSWKGMIIGMALAKDGMLKNRLARWLVHHRQQISGG